MPAWQAACKSTRLRPRFDAGTRWLLRLPTRFLVSRLISRRSGFAIAKRECTERFLQQRALPEDYLQRIPPLRTDAETRSSLAVIRNTSVVDQGVSIFDRGLVLDPVQQQRLRIGSRAIRQGSTTGEGLLANRRSIEARQREWFRSPRIEPAESSEADPLKRPSNVAPTNPYSSERLRAR